MTYDEDGTTWARIAAWYERHGEHDWVSSGDGFDVAPGIMLGLAVALRHPEWAAAMVMEEHEEYGCKCGNWTTCPHMDALSLVAESPVSGLS